MHREVDEQTYIVNKLDEHEVMLKEISTELKKLDILLERVGTIAETVNTHATYFAPGGVVSKMITQQETFKSLKGQITALWRIAIPIMVVLIGVGISLSCQ